MNGILYHPITFTHGGQSLVGVVTMVNSSRKNGVAYQVIVPSMGNFAVHAERGKTAAWHGPIPANGKVPPAEQPMTETPIIPEESNQ